MWAACERAMAKGPIALLAAESPGNPTEMHAKKEGHSLRRGFITSAVTAGKPMNKIIEVTRHKDMRTLQEYFDDAHKFSDHALAGLL